MAFDWLREYDTQGIDHVYISTVSVRGLNAARSFDRDERIFSVPSTAMLDSTALVADGATVLEHDEEREEMGLEHLIAAVCEGKLARAYEALMQDVRVDAYPVWWVAFPAAYPRTLRFLKNSSLRHLLPSLRAHSNAYGWELHKQIATALHTRGGASREVVRRICNPFALMRAVVLAHSRYFREVSPQGLEPWSFVHGLSCRL